MRTCAGRATGSFLAWAAASATTNDAGPSGIIPFTTGLNVSSARVPSTTPATALHYPHPRPCLPAQSPFQPQRLPPHLPPPSRVQTTLAPIAKPVYASATEHGSRGDAFAAHLDAHPDLPTTTAPSLGLLRHCLWPRAGQTTYDFNNHLEKSSELLPDIESHRQIPLNAHPDTGSQELPNCRSPLPLPGWNVSICPRHKPEAISTKSSPSSSPHPPAGSSKEDHDRGHR